MLTPSVVRTVWKQRYTPQNKNLGLTPRELRHSKTNEKSVLNAEQIERMKIWRVNHLKNKSDNE